MTKAFISIFFLFAITTVGYAQNTVTSRMKVKGYFDNDNHKDKLTYKYKTVVSEDESGDLDDLTKSAEVDGKIKLSGGTTLNFTDSVEFEGGRVNALTYSSPQPGIIIRSVLENSGSHVTEECKYYVYDSKFNNWFLYKKGIYKQEPGDNISVNLTYYKKLQDGFIGPGKRVINEPFTDPMLETNTLETLCKYYSRKKATLEYEGFVRCIDVLNNIDRKANKEGIRQLANLLKKHYPGWAKCVEAGYLK
ncbi:hypothetical protein [Prevotella aurantiaca]